MTSLLGFWRVKRWERGIAASQNVQSARHAPQQQATDQPTSQFERLFGLHRISRGDLFRQGFGFGPRESEATADHTAQRAEEGEIVFDENDLIIPVDPNDLNRVQTIREALAHERRLQTDLRTAGLL